MPPSFVYDEFDFYFASFLFSVVVVICVYLRSLSYASVFDVAMRDNTFLCRWSLILWLL